MTTTRLDVIDRSVEKTHIWLNELSEELATDDSHHAYRVLRAFLHALRDHLSVNEAAALAAQLPIFVRGVFYEGWDPSRTPDRARDLDSFLERIADEARLGGETEASFAAAAAGKVLAHHISPGEAEACCACCPDTCASSSARRALVPGPSDVPEARGDFGDSRRTWSRVDSRPIRLSSSAHKSSSCASTGRSVRRVTCASGTTSSSGSQVELSTSATDSDASETRPGRISRCAARCASTRAGARHSTNSNGAASANASAKLSRSGRWRNVASTSAPPREDASLAARRPSSA